MQRTTLFYFSICLFVGFFTIQSNATNVISSPLKNRNIQQIAKSNSSYNDTFKADFVFREDFSEPQNCFTNKSVNGSTYKWCFDVYEDSLTARKLLNPIWQSTEENPCFSYMSSGCYFVALEVTHPNGVDRDTVMKKVCHSYVICIRTYITFTPGIDSTGKEKVFDIPIKNCQFYNLHIYNRYGTKVFHSEDTNNDWNGKLFNTGPNAADGTYYYYLQHISENKADTSERYGVLFLIRKNENPKRKRWRKR